MPLIKDGHLVEDRWTHVGDDEPIGLGVAPIVSLERWQAERETLSLRGPLGIRLRSDQSPALIAEDLHQVSLIALDFPKFTDGRSYSHARLLRDRYGFEGELRAVGNVLRDQFQFMLRCGFDALEVADVGQAGFDALVVADAGLADVWQQVVGEIVHVYQRASDRSLPAWALRLSETPPAAARPAGSLAY